jgi:serine/threonine-protein kinase
LIPLDTATWRQVDELLARALDEPGPERHAFVERNCTDERLRPILFALLERDATPAFLEDGAVDHALPFLADLEEEGAAVAPGDPVGPYRLVREIGRGGMSVVFLAERADGKFQRRVAVKLIQAHLAPTRFRARFEAEREILARLDHPAIARLLDGGETEGGEPYLVMEYVEGEAIDAYCRRRGLAVPDRLALFLEIGRAVAYAHQNLVVHRDLKPRNVVVSETGAVKLLDFGIAKVLADDAAGSAETVTAERLMTPAYASPEQIRGEPIQTVSDVYSLGVLLFELLTGTLPYGGARLPHELAGAILDREPMRPSLAAAGADRGRLRGDLDAIILKALRKRPEQRYPSVDALLDDVRRHLAGAPVAVRGEDRWYRIGKIARRNWPLLAGTAAVALAIAGAAAFHARRIETERDVARREAAIAASTTRFLVSLFQASDAWESSPARADALTARELLDKGTQRIRTELADQPEVRAELLGTLGSIHSGLGHWSEAETLLGEALAWDRRFGTPEKTAEDLDRLALLYYRTGSYPDAVSLGREASDLLKRRFGPDSAEAAVSLVKLAMALRKNGGLPESERLYREALGTLRRVRGNEDKDVAAALKGLAMVRRERGDLVEAEAFAREGLAISLRVLPEGDPLTTEHVSDLASILRSKGDLAEAEALSRRALASTREWFGDLHPNVAQRYSSLGLILQDAGKFAEAEACYRESLRLNQALFGQRHPQIATNLNNLGTVRHDQEALADAQHLLEEALEMRRQILSPGHADVAVTLANLAAVALDRGEPARAASLFEEALASLHAHAPDHFKVPAAEIGLGRALAALGRTRDAEPHLRRALVILEPKGGSPALTVCRAALGRCLLQLQRAAEARPLLAQARAGLPRLTAPRDRRFVEASLSAER